MAEIKVKLYDFQGKELGEEILDSKLFGVAVDPQIIQEIVVSQRKNAREVLAHTKGRSEVRGGGKKPWKQKGTGRARHGSIRSPLWIGGGITFGPTRERNFSVKVNKKVKKKAMAMVLSDKVANSKLVLVESYNLPEAKTKLLQTAFTKLPNKNKSTLVVTKSAEENIVRASKNLPKVHTINYGSLNLVDLMKNEYLVLNKELLKKVSEHYL
ncbi:MAG: 50S ribosomal protein L4 [Candidatus Komeilibacteria bacterium RIFOXYC1_FULL_37_11]|uniref:Large ribosomal subunit protein uL4 n=1 Tax=Candidatus Komeilibacteria bacterium RIFOXYC1_FULL_37_11 TaxID=1798555 RepID=A0A1G2BYI2_9BACT|nr:MAG: 50S ribosomal protein L4 [Candidatus Komeilibacteria bacterium RIFOXYC1_FULL_37_11]OGY95347.1 MAG: 50S ribosomal protein L4 [Candidatus Komeilibacteria bacterium RIFOXYD1_FULL_37_29]OGY97218.1 MAG: 50S ribosomal protein L4 [Candidatus Komeilibacteria bacterium RIFOXYD2_FULL_37_8]